MPSKKVTGKKRVTKKKTKNEKDIARISKKVVMSLAETKLGYFRVDNAIPLGPILLSWNLMYQCGFVNGTAGENATYIGDEITIVGIGGRFVIRNNYANGKFPSHITLALVMTPKYATTSSLTAGDLFPSYNTGYPFRFDSDKCKVLLKKIVQVDPRPIDGQGSEEVHIYHSFGKNGKNFKFQTDGTIGAYALKDYNLYLVCVGASWNSFPNESVGAIYGTCEVYYKDM